MGLLRSKLGQFGALSTVINIERLTSTFKSGFLFLLKKKRGVTSIDSYS